ncbi:SDR family NAD(P)-dependent oxidoreductase [Larsenimonas rhizosphaerae]|uniref:SDR family NAD(P)-dependent oxidoreductase n=1 Tax=Larsenimonas rhizosphaerae TaxID=2944682 RepID=A0AA41ZDW1_9GAMM|nr:SDR family NAD(P)-dependent oxidoreductase [Larsenimonas rhizosphaerae]MCX2523032.1 SDR family NAD(P)-dependent oxidoreductase [Larsenimonas rhizosphaerae]
MFSHLPTPFNALVTGGGGLGQAFATELLTYRDVKRLWLTTRRELELDDERARVLQLDATTAEGQQVLADETDGHPIHLWIHTVGALHSDSIRPEKRLEALDTDQLSALFRINAGSFGGLLGHLTPSLSQGPCIVAALSARIGSISDNRLGGWYGYRASKAALNMLIKTAAIEMKRRNPQAILLSLHPGTTDTELSAPFQHNVPAEKLFTPDYAARCLLGVMSRRTPEDSGSFRDWNDMPVDW